MEISGASVHISDSQSHYPGTSDRVIYIAGMYNEVNLAQSLIWEMIGQQTFAETAGKRSIKWSPSEVNPLTSGKTGEYDDVLVYGQITIPAAAGGHIVGRSGSHLKFLSDESGVHIDIDDKMEADSLQTYERVIFLEGTAAACMKCTSLILKKISTLEEGSTYSYPGTGYPKSSTRSNNKDLSSKVSKQDDAEKFHFDTSIPLTSSSCAEVLSAHTTIEIAVPDHFVGAILGVQVSLLSYCKLYDLLRMFVLYRERH
jgi:predicted DNA-binding transcriptional regulator AlpA